MLERALKEVLTYAAPQHPTKLLDNQPAYHPRKAWTTLPRPGHLENVTCHRPRDAVAGSVRDTASLHKLVVVQLAREKSAPCIDAWLLNPFHYFRVVINTEHIMHVRTKPPYHAAP